MLNKKVFEDYKNCKNRNDCIGCEGAKICSIGDYKILNEIVEYIDSLQRSEGDE